MSWKYMIITFLLLSIETIYCQTSLTFFVKEDAPLGSIVDHIGDNNEKSFILSDTDYFKLDGNKIVVKSKLDRDINSDLCKGGNWPKKCSWKGVIFTDQSQHVSLEIIIEDVNDNTPEWQIQSFGRFTNDIRVSIQENNQIGQVISLPSAVDLDYGDNSIVSYELVHNGDFQDVFSLMKINSPDGIVPQLVINKRLDYEERSEYNLTIIARDGPGKTGTGNLIVQVIDENDNAPQFNHSPEEDPFIIRIDEDLRINSKLPRHPVAKDEDFGVLGKITYQFSLATQEHVRRDFTIDKDTGEIIVRNNLDYDSGSNRDYSFTVIAKDGGNPPLSSETRVKIILSDVNDNKPTIKLSPLSRSGNLEILEGIEPGQLLATITVNDLDEGQNGEFTCSLNSGDNLKLVYVPMPEMTVYQLISRKKFDREVESVVRDTLICPDKGEPQQIAKKYIQLDIIDINDNPPMFNTQKFSFNIHEGNKKSIAIGKVRAMDRDIHPNDAIEYSIIWPSELGPQMFNIDPNGTLVSIDEIDRELNPKGYYFQVIARDPKRADFNSTTYVEIALTDINDCVPEFIQPSYQFSVEETDQTARDPSYSSYKNFHEVGKVKATDCDLGSNAMITYSILNTDVPFKIDKDGTIYTNGILDREQTPAYLLTVQAKDMPSGENEEKSLSSQVKVNIAITDVNDNPPTFIFPSPERSKSSPNDLNDTTNTKNISYKEPVGFHVAKVEAVDEDQGENGRVTYRIYRQAPQQDFFRIDENSGEIVLAKRLTFSDLGPIRVHLSASDNGKPNEKKSYSELVIRIVDEEPISGRLLNNLQTTSTSQYLLALFSKDKIIIVSIALATVIISTALIMIICLIFRGCPKSKSSWAETRRSLVLGRPFTHEEMMNGYHGNTLSSFDFPSESDNNLADEKKDPNIGLIFSNGINLQQTNGTIRQNYYKSANQNYSTLRNFSPSTLSQHNQSGFKQNTLLARMPETNPPPSSTLSPRAQRYDQSAGNIVYSYYTPTTTNGIPVSTIPSSANELVFTNFDNLTTTFINSNDSTTNEAKSTSSETMTRMSERIFDLNS